MPTAEITRDETAGRARLLRVGCYDIELDLTRGPETFRSTSIISFDCEDPGTSSYVDLVAETVHQVTLNGASVDPASCYADDRITLTGLAERNELRVVADCRYRTDGTGLQRAVDSADGRVYLHSQFAAADARKVYANFEQPDLKAEFTFRVIVPERWIVFSNQPAPEPQPAGAGYPVGATIWHFPPTPRISTYLTAICAGEYHLVRDSHVTPAGQVIPLGLACRQSMAEFLEPDDVFAVTKQGFDYYTTVFGTGYPFAKYDQVYVPDSAGAMENVGCVTITESLIFRSKVTDALYERRTMVILHEMAHMWFGDLVTMRWWDDLWLNESFAEMCAFQSAAEATRFTDSWTTFCGGRKSGGYQQDQLPSSHPVATSVATLSEAEANFDGISYAKGASVLKQLVAYVGRDAFFAGIRAYFAEHGWRNATLADLIGALESSSGRSLVEWSSAWLQTAGPNTLRPDFTVGSDGTFIEFSVLQEAPAEFPTLRPHHIAIGLYNRTASGQLVRTYRVETDVTGPRTSVSALAGHAQPDLILLNDDDLDYAIVRFDQRSLTVLEESIADFADGLARTICWSAVIDMARQGELSVPAFVKIVIAGMGREPQIAVLQQLHGATSLLLMTTADPAWVREGTEQLAAASADLLGASEPGSDQQLAWMQMLGRTATNAEQLDLVTAVLDGTVQFDGLAVDTELRWTLLSRLVSMGRARDTEIDAELRRDNTDAGRRHATACRASIPDAEHKEEAWQLLTASDKLGVEDTIEIGLGFNQVAHADLLAPYAEKYFGELPQIWSSRDGLLRIVIGQVLFPYAAASAELLDLVAGFLALPGIDPSLRRSVIEGRDIAEKALASRTLSS
jgi:aminopeptidase N